MDRALFYLRIFPGTEAEYDRRHAEIWPELVDEIRESGLRNFSGFRRGTDVWYYTEAEPATSPTAFAVHGPKPANQRWNHYFRDVIAQITDDSGNLLWYDKVFESDGAPLDGPYERGLFGLVIDPERADDYEALHANPWPDLMAAIEASGFRKYQGFRRGAHVVYYGEFYPDMKTVFARMAEHEVNARWGDRLRGDHHDDHRRRRQLAHRRRDLPPGLTCPTARPIDDRGSGSSTRTGRSGSTRPARPSGPTGWPSRASVAADLAETIDPVAVVEIASADDGLAVGRRFADLDVDVVLVLQTMAVPAAWTMAAMRRLAGGPGRGLGAARDRSCRGRLRSRLHHDAGRDGRGADALQPAVARGSAVRAGAGPAVGPGRSSSGARGAASRR